MGRTFQVLCDAALGDARCGVDLDAPAFGGAGSVAEAVGDRGLLAAGLGAFAAGWFDLGFLTWTSGANDGGRAEIARHTIEADAARIELFEAPVLTFAQPENIKSGFRDIDADGIIHCLFFFLCLSSGPMDRVSVQDR